MFGENLVPDVGQNALCQSDFSNFKRTISRINEIA